MCPSWCLSDHRLLPGRRCLQDHLDDEDMSQECKAEVEQDQVRSNQDFRLNFRLSKACKKDIAALCIHECSTYLGQACGGKVSVLLSGRSVCGLHPCNLLGNGHSPDQERHMTAGTCTVVNAVARRQASWGCSLPRQSSSDITSAT